MKLKKAMLAFLTSLFGVLLFACNGVTTQTDTSATTQTTGTTAATTAPETSTTTLPFTTMSPDSIYLSYPVDAYSVSSGAATYRAEMGYYLMAEQGYNNWYYDITSDDGTYQDMTHNGSYWSREGAIIMDGIMSPSASASAVRTFDAPVTGEATIYGTFRMYAASEGDAYVRIMVNSTLVYPTTEDEKLLQGNDLEGYFHKLTLDLQSGDKVRFIVRTDGDEKPLVYWNPVVDYLNLSDDYLHYGMTDFVGDVHPYYYDDQLYLYYLSTDGSFASTLATSADMVNFIPQTLTTTRLNAPGSFYYVLGVIKEGNYFRSFYGEGKNVGSSKSLDLLEWESGIVWDEETYEKQYSPASNYPAGIRDPYAYYNPDLGKYHIVATGYKANQNYAWSNTTGFDAYIVLFTSTGPSLADWEKNPVTGRVGYHIPLLHFGDWVNNVDIGDPECSEIFKLGDRWYILASLSGRGGDHWVGRPSYWVGDESTDILAMDWQAIIDQEYHLDGEDLCAAQVYEVGGKQYIFGWITQRNYGYGWGGTVNLPREVYQKDDGTLGSRLDSDFLKLINSGNLFNLRNDLAVLDGFEQIEGRLTLTAGDTLYGYQTYGTISVPGTFDRTMIEMDLALSDDFEAGGVLVGAENNAVEIGIRSTDTGYELYLKNQGTLGKVSATNAVTLDPSGVQQLTIILEGNVAEIYLNGEYALSARSSELLDSDVTLAAFASGLGGVIDGFRIDQLTPAKDFGH